MLNVIFKTKVYFQRRPPTNGLFALCLRKRGIHCVLLLLSVFIPVFGDDDIAIKSIEMPNARASAMGGFHAALTDDYSSAFYNPAGFAAFNTIAPRATIAEISGELSGANTFYKIYADEMDIASKEVIKLAKDGIDANLSLAGPIAFGRIDNGFGWRVYNATRAYLVWDRDVVFELNPRFSEEVTGTIGYGLRILDSDSTLDIGVAVKGFYRAAYAPESVFIQEIKHILSQMDENRFISEIGASFDIGIRWTQNDTVSLGLVYKDFWSPVYVSYYKNMGKYFNQEMYGDSGAYSITPKLAAGFAVRIKSPIMHNWNTDIIFALDYNGFTTFFAHSPCSRLLEIAAGLELRFLEVISVRACWADWLPGFGFGVNFTAFKFDFAVRGKELGENPGDKSTYVAAFSIQFTYDI